MPTTSPPPTAAQQALDRLDRLLADQLRLIVEHPEFRALATTWRGLHHLVTHLPTDPSSKIRILDLSKHDLHRSTTREAHRSPADRALHAKIVEATYRDAEEPFGLLVADYEFGRGPQDVGLLRALGEIAGAAPVPLVTAAAPDLVGLNAWTELPEPSEPFGLHGLGMMTAWRQWRQMPSSRFVFVCLPRLLSRETVPPDDRARDWHGVGRHSSEGAADRLDALHPGYGVALAVGDAFARTGWWADSDPVGADLPRARPEVAIGPARASDLVRAGLTPWGSDFRGGQDAASTLGCVLTLCRFAAGLRAVVAHSMLVGNLDDPDRLRTRLATWLSAFMGDDLAPRRPPSAPRLPLTAADVDIEPDPLDRGAWRARLRVRLPDPFPEPSRDLEIETGLRQPWMFR